MLDRSSMKATVFADPVLVKALTPEDQVRLRLASQLAGWEIVLSADEEEP
jgi:hypothetical protein